MDRDRQYLHAEVDRELDRGVGLTAEIKKTALKSHKTMHETAGTLQGQGEQLRKIDRTLDGMNQDLKEADANLKDVESMWYSWLPKWAKKNNEAYSSKDINKQVAPSKKEKQPSASSRPKEQQPKGRYVERVVGDKREDQMNDDLDLVGNLLDDMLVTAHEMGSELDGHNVLIKRMDAKTEKLDTKTSKINHRVGRQLR